MKTSKIILNIAAIFMVVGFLGAGVIQIWQRFNGITSENVFAGKGIFAQLIVGGLFPIGLFVLMPLALWFRQREDRRTEP